MSPSSTRLEMLSLIGWMTHSWHHPLVLMPFLTHSLKNFCMNGTYTEGARRLLPDFQGGRGEGGVQRWIHTEFVDQGMQLTTKCTAGLCLPTSSRYTLLVFLEIPVCLKHYGTFSQWWTLPYLNRVDQPVFRCAKCSDMQKFGWMKFMQIYCTLWKFSIKSPLFLKWMIFPW